MTSDTLVLTISKDPAPILGQYRLVAIRKPTVFERLRSRLNGSRAKQRRLPVFSSGLSVSIRMDAGQYAQIMGMALQPNPADGYATADLIPTPAPEQQVRDQGICV